MSRNPRNNWSSVPVPAHTSWSCVLFFFVFFFSFFGSAEVTSLHAALPLLSAVGRLCGSSGMAGAACQYGCAALPLACVAAQPRPRAVARAFCTLLRSTCHPGAGRGQTPRRRGAKAKAPRRCSNGACTGRAGTTVSPRSCPRYADG